MLAFLLGLALGVLATLALLGFVLVLVLRGGNRATAAHVLHAAALALKTKPSPVNKEVQPCDTSTAPSPSPSS